MAAVGQVGAANGVMAEPRDPRMGSPTTGIVVEELLMLGVQTLNRGERIV